MTTVADRARLAMMMNPSMNSIHNSSNNFGAPPLQQTFARRKKVIQRPELDQKFAALVRDLVDCVDDVLDTCEWTDTNRTIHWRKYQLRVTIRLDVVAYSSSRKAMTSEGLLGEKEVTVDVDASMNRHILGAEGTQAHEEYAASMRYAGASLQRQFERATQAHAAELLRRRRSAEADGDDLRVCIDVCVGIRDRGDAEIAYRLYRNGYFRTPFTSAARADNWQERAEACARVGNCAFRDEGFWCVARVHKRDWYALAPGQPLSLSAEPRLMSS